MNGRGEWIRTTGLLVPNQALYQAEPRPELFQFNMALQLTLWGKVVRNFLGRGSDLRRR